MGGMRDRAASWLSFRTFRSQATPADTGRDSPAGREKFPTLPAGANEGFVGANEKDSPPARSSDEQDAGGRRASSEVRDPRSAVRVVPRSFPSYLGLRTTILIGHRSMGARRR